MTLQTRRGWIAALLVALCAPATTARAQSADGAETEPPDGGDFDVDFGGDEAVESAIVEKTRASFDGDVKTESFIYPGDEDAGPARHAVDVKARIEAQREATSARATLLVRKDLADASRDRFDADEAYIDFGRGNTRLRVGRSHASWGAATLFNPADQITPVDLTDFIEDEARPALMAWGRARLGQIGLEVFLLPVPETSVVPLPTAVGADGALVGDNRWLSGSLPVDIDGMPVSYSVAPAEPPAASPGNAGGAIRARVAVAGADLALGYGTFISRIPTLREEVAVNQESLEVTLRPEFVREHLLTLEAARPFGRARLAFEAAATIPEGTGGGERDAYVSAVASFDYTSAQFSGDHTASVVVEVITTQPLEGSLPIDPLSRARYRFAAAAAARAEYRMGPRYRARLLAVQNLDSLGLGRLDARDGGHHDLYIYPELEAQLFGDITATVGFALLRGARGSLFGTYEKNSRLFVSFAAAL